jgi:methyl-accepting chemotaxis protein
MKKYFTQLSLQWKLQIAFMAVAMVTTLYNRWRSAVELQSVISLARSSELSQSIILKLEQQYADFLVQSVLDASVQFLIQFFVIAVFARVIVAPMVELSKSLAAVESGDLTKAVNESSEDEIGVLGKRFNMMLERLNSILSSVDRSVLHMGQSSCQISAISFEIEENSLHEEQKSAELLAATADMHDISAKVSESVELTSHKALATRERAVGSHQALQANIEQLDVVSSGIASAASEVNALSEAAHAIVSQVTDIQGIAEQTNLLALNAAIEAARAGEQGRGFAVVADEVRALAARTTNSAMDVQKVINALMERVRSSVLAMNNLQVMLKKTSEDIYQTGDLISAMSNDAEETAQLNHDIQQACNQQMDRFGALEDILRQLLGVLQKNALKIANTKNISDSLEHLTDTLREQISGWKFQRINPQSLIPDNCRRGALRYKGQQLIAIELDGETFNGVTMDISEKGVRARFNRKLPEHNSYSLSIRLPYLDQHAYKKGKPLDVQVTPEWQKKIGENQFEYGFSFVDLTEDQRKKIDISCRFFG